MITVYFYIKGQPKDYKRFETMSEAQAFIKAMKLNDDCESVGIQR